MNQAQPINLQMYLDQNKHHPYEMVTIMIQMAQIVDNYHKNNQTLGRFKLVDFIIESIPKTNNYSVKFIGQPLYNKIYDIQGQSQNELQKIYEAPDLYDYLFDYQCDIYQLGVWFAFMIAKKYINHLNKKDLDIYQDYMPLVTWVIQTMLDKIPCCRPGLDVIIERLLKFEFKGQLVINQGTFIVRKLPSFKILSQQQFYSLTQLEGNLNYGQFKESGIEAFPAQDIRVIFINCFQPYKFSRNRDITSNIINTIIRIKPKEKDIIYLQKNQKEYKLEEKQFKNQQFEAYFFKQQSKLLFFQFKLKQEYEKDEFDINFKLKDQFEDQREFIRFNYLDCYIHILDIQQIIEKYENKDYLKNQAKLQFVWDEKFFKSPLEWVNPEYFWKIKSNNNWKIKSNKKVKEIFQLIEPDTEVSLFQEEKFNNIATFVDKFFQFLLYLKDLGLTLRRLSFDNYLSSYFKQNLPLNCIHLRNFKEKQYQLILLKFYRISIDWIIEEIKDIDAQIKEQLAKNYNLQKLQEQKIELKALRDDLLYKLNYN